MNKKILTLAIAAISLLSVQSFAQNPDSTKCRATKCEAQACKKENCKKDNCKKEECKKDKCCKRQRNFAPVDSAVAFNGIELTQQQSARIAQINADCKAKFEKARAEKRQAAKADSALTAEQKRAKGIEKGQRRMQARLDYFHQIQQVLSPEQYITFLENTAAGAASPQSKPAMHRKGKDGQRKADGHRGNARKMHEKKMQAARRSN